MNYHIFPASIHVIWFWESVWEGLMKLSTHRVLKFSCILYNTMLMTIPIIKKLSWWEVHSFCIQEVGHSWPCASNKKVDPVQELSAATSTQ